MNANLRTNVVVALITVAAFQSAALAGNPGKTIRPVQSHQVVSQYTPVMQQHSTPRLVTTQIVPVQQVAAPSLKIKTTAKQSAPKQPVFDAKQSQPHSERIVVTIDGQRLLVDEELLIALRQAYEANGQLRLNLVNGIEYTAK